MISPDAEARVYLPVVLPTSMPQILAPLAAGRIFSGSLDFHHARIPHQWRDLNEISFSHEGSSVLRKSPPGGPISKPSGHATNL